ncbi:MAG: hypothetical protein H0X39_13775 [Actinobacteria bacterium]|nr:hypothetical protein [Actinomycetota bacterium]
MASVVVVGSIKIGNTGKSNDTPLVDKPAWVYHEPARLRLTPADRKELFARASLFIKTAVARKRLDAAWLMLGPEMRAGQTRKSWDTGTNNVIPFPAVGIANWDVLYAYRNDVAIDLAVVGARSSDWAGKTFTIELKRYGKHPHNWLVASWVPKGIGGSRQVKSLAQLPPPPPPKAPLSARWLLAPLSIFGLLLLSLIAFGLRSTIRARRAAKRYAQALGYSSTSSPS